jgi:beta-lactamase regulating signal transducer with metallopeptidase domain
VTPLEFLIGTLLLKPAILIAVAVGIAAYLRSHTAAARHALWTGTVLAMVLLPILGFTVPSIVIPAVLSADRALTRSPELGGASAPGRGPTAAAWNGPDMAFLDSSPLPVVEIVLAVWIAGVLLVGVRRVKAARAAARIAGRARPIPDPRFLRILDRARSSTGIRGVELRMSDETASPVAIGVLRSVILVPVEALAWTDTEITAALTHEAGHVARKDGLRNLLSGVATALYWFHPAVHLAARRMRTEGERACDDQVLRAGVGPEEYALLLLNVARSARSLGSIAGVPAMARLHELERRLLAVLDGEVTRAAVSRWASFALTLVTLIVALPVGALTVGPRVPEIVGPFGPEPDLLGDTWSRPSSERISLPQGAYRLSPGARQALEGPDSVLAGIMAAGLAHEPEGEWDLIRDRAAWTLLQARGGRLVEPLLDALDAPDWRVSAYAAWALATARDPRSVPRLLPLLNHPVWRMRAMAAYALRESGDARAEDAMRAALADPAWQVRVEAVTYLVALGGPRRRESLRPYLEDRHVAVRRAAQNAFLNL